VAALLAANHTRLGEGQSAHRDYYRRIKGEDQAVFCEESDFPVSLRFKLRRQAFLAERAIWDPPSQGL
jgi:hypothetical protein